MMSFQDNVNQMLEEIETVLDLDELESRIYLSLLRLGPITASALAKELDIDRAKAYRTIDKLVCRDIISTTFSNPKFCIAVEPQKALKLSLEKKEEEVTVIKEKGVSLIDKINNEILVNHETRISTFRIIHGRTNIYADIAHLIDNSSDVIYIATTLEDISKMYHSTIPEKITNCEKNGGTVRLLVELDDPKLVPFVKRFNATETRICKLPSQGRMIVQKHHQLIMFDSHLRQLSNNYESNFSLSTNSSEIVANIFSLCELLWQTASPLETINIKHHLISESNTILSAS
ncbi:MAG: TrmB family transcriptional regulator [Nitrosopumilales archaeon CG11_big_fil_rev_8_21_14_0_20_33_24]|nr:MAG: TrmB family transcriptional regulator [Nitrosopumilales archaeon CG11_big_fil_rev_8_21_14_0_20_33_24]